MRFPGISPRNTCPPELVIATTFSGELGGYDNNITELSVVKGLMRAAGDEPVSLVNAHEVAKDRGMKVNSMATTSSNEYLNVITVRGAGHSLAATFAGASGEPRIVMVDDHLVDISPAEHMLLVHNDDRPGVIGRVGSILGEADINIADMSVGRAIDGSGAMMVISTTQTTPESVVDRLRDADGVTDLSSIELHPRADQIG